MTDNNNVFWYSEGVDAVKIGDQSTTSSGMTAEYNLENWKYPAIYDTGTSLIYAPGGVGTELQLRLAHGKEYIHDSSSGLMMVNCDEKASYEDFYLTIDDYQFKILAEDYILAFDDTDDAGVTTTVCFMGIVASNDMSYWLLGDVFLTGYYSIFDNSDHDNGRIGFAPHATSSKPVVGENMPYINTKVDDILWEHSWLFWAWRGPGFEIA